MVNVSFARYMRPTKHLKRAPFDQETEVEIRPLLETSDSSYEALPRYGWRGRETVK
jgi:hypothetical protein